jgi:hypothetical protein
MRVFRDGAAKSGRVCADNVSILTRDPDRNHFLFCQAEKNLSPGRIDFGKKVRTDLVGVSRGGSS